MATSVKHPPENFPLVVPFHFIQNRLASIRVSVLIFRRCSLNFRLLYTDRFISDQNLPFADMQACLLSVTKSPLKGHMVTGYRNMSQKMYVLGNSKFIFAGNV